MRQRLRTLSLLRKFSLASLALVIGLAFVLSHLLGDMIERRARENAVASARALAQVGIRRHVSEREIRHGLSDQRVRQLDANLVAADLRELGVDRIKLFSADPPQIVYSDDHSTIGEDASKAPNVNRALRGELVDILTNGTDHTGRGVEMLSVYVPAYFGLSPRPNAVVELYIPYAPTRAAITRDTRRVQIALAIGLIVLWAALFRIVGTASRQLRHQLAENRHRATHDALTGLANESQLLALAEEVLSDGHSAALMLLDLDGFKEINDSLGHEHGDEVLREVAGRLDAVMRPSDVLARLAADEFAVLVPDVPSGDAGLIVAERLLATLREPLALPALSVRLGVSVGVAVAPEHGTKIADLVRCADLAMYRAKREMSEIELYRPERDALLPDRISLSTELPKAIERGELVVYYQPQIDIETGRVGAAEARVRWDHADRGLIPPDQFIPLAETTGVIADLTRYVLDQALAEQARWRAAGHSVPVAVNFANANVLDVDMPDVVRTLLERYEVPRGALIVEISERTVMHGPQRLSGLLDQLREMGVESSLDDFGTGQSSLAFVRSLPVDEIKIDRSFVFDMLTDEADAAIAGSTIALGRALGLRVVAEGVEDEATRAALAERGCHVAQGYLISRPVPDEDFRRWLGVHDAPAARARPASLSRPRA